MLPPETQKFYDKVGAYTKTEEWKAFNEAIGDVLDEQRPTPLALVVLICKFVDFMDAKQPEVGKLIVALLAHRVGCPLIDIPEEALTRLRS